MIYDRTGQEDVNFDHDFTQDFAMDFWTCFGSRLHKVFILGSNFIYNTMFTLLKPFLGESIKTKIVLVSSNDQLKDFITEDNLLLEHGGTLEWKYNPEEEYKI